MFIERWRKLKSLNVQNKLELPDCRLVLQYHLLLALPLLSPIEQVEILLELEDDDEILSSLIEVIEPLDELSFDNLLNTARKDKDEFRQFLLLAVAHSSGTKLSYNVCQYVASLVTSEIERLRMLAFAVITQSGNIQLLTAVAQCSWDANCSNAENSFEVWYGSESLLQAAVNGLIGHQEVLDRI